MDHRPLGAVEARIAGGIDAHGEHHGGARPVGEQARRPFRQRRRVQRRLVVGEVDGAAPAPRLLVELALGVDEEADVGDGVVQDQVVARSLDRKRLVEIGRRRRVERHEGDRRAIGVAAPGSAAGRLLGGGDDLGRELAGDVGLGPDGVEAGGDRSRRESRA